MFTSAKKKHLRQIERSASDVALASANAEVYHKRMLSQITKTLADEEAAANQQQAMIEAELKQVLDEVQKKFNATKSHINEEQSQRLEILRNQANHELLTIDTTSHQSIQGFQDKLNTNMAAIKDRYNGAVANVQTILSDVDLRLGNLCKPWKEILSTPYTCPKSMAEAVRFGTLSVPGSSTPLEIPALLPFIGGKNIIIKAAGSEAKAMAVQALQNMILRLLLFSPPSELRLLLIDPVGLGNNLAFFLPHDDELQVANNRHVNTISADQFKQQMVGGKVWVDSADIDKRLAEMSAHLEMVVQKYLRGEIKSMEDYNREAGESGEAFKLMAVVNFPVNFSDQTAQRLAKITANGPRCGVYSLITWDMDQKPLHGFNPGDLENNATILRWENDRFVWEDPDFQQAVLSIEEPPSLKESDQIIQTIWQQARLASRKVLPFSKIVPKPEFHLLWDEKPTPRTTQFGIRVPIGQSGAKGQQFFELGQGVAHHAMLTGQTGTGKSTLLHIIICSLATAYSPDELELYLIDFKKGVEFQAYAPTDDGLGALPHACVIAIESEREFGLSCLQALDAKMAERGDLFSSVGCQDIAGYRDKTGKPLPRILLLVDEFQVFFEESDQGGDRISEQAKYYLHRLASQGRNAGIHIMLATQTLQHKSIPSGIMTQIAVRIALKASTEQDSLSMIGNKDAYTLLERMGEAWYNSANGLPQNNDRFQAPYLSEDEKDNRLRDFKMKHPNNKDVVIFKGSEEAKIEDSPYWHKLLALLTWPAKSRTLDVHLGLPVAIKAPTSGRFFHQSGRNMLVVGRDEKAVVGILSAIVCDLAAQRQKSELRFLLWNLNHFESPYSNLPEDFKQALSSYNIDIGKTREIPDMIQEMAAIIDKRLATKNVGNPEIFIIGFGLQRCRDLFPDSAIRAHSPAAHSPNQIPIGIGIDVVRSVGPGTLFAKILREGPAVGVHVIGWWDSYISLNKVVDRNLLREFGMRVVLNMSKEDSRNLVDENDAAKLAPHRALFWEEEEIGKLEKFIPFAPPSNKEWLRSLGEYLSRRS